MNKSKLAAGAAAAVLGVAVLMRALHQEPFAEAVADPVVQVSEPERRDIRLTTSLIGTVEPENVVYVYPKASGEVTEVNVKAGQVVEAGQQICVIDTDQIESAKSNLDAAELALRQAKEELSRQSVLYAGGGISEQAYRQYQDNVESAQISYDSAKNAYDNQVSYSVITAPISGLIEVCNIQEFDQISQSDQVCVISGQSAKMVSFSVTERIRSELKEGDQITVEKDGQEFTGTIDEISTMADEKNGLFTAKARLDGGDYDYMLSTGSTVKLSVISDSQENALAVPVDAVYYEGGASYVYTYDQGTGTLHQAEVETGIQDEDWVQIIAGLEGGEQVVTTWTSELYEGTSVRVKESESETETAETETPTETENQKP